MGQVRPFSKTDIPEIIELNKRLFPGSSALSTETQEFLFNNICFHNPWYDGTVGSLVYEENDKRIIGFLGVIPRRMLWNGESICVGVGQHLMVDRAALASVQIFKQFLNGPYDLAMGDMSVDVTRKIWERLGGSTSYLHSIYWIRPLRPGSFVVSALKKKNSVGSIFTPIGNAIDVLAARSTWSPYRQISDGCIGIDLTLDQFLQYLPQFSNDVSLKPEYDQQSIGWLFNILAQEKRFGTFKKILVTSKDGDILGWYLYNLKVHGRSEVIQIAATQQTVDKVLAHLFHHAWSHGSIEIAGRVEPKFMKAYTEHYCLFTPGKNWMLIHSRRPEISQAIFRGDAFLSRLEGDLWFF